MPLMDAFNTVNGGTVNLNFMQLISKRQVYLKPWTGPWDQREFPDNLRYGQHVRRFCHLTGASDGEGTQLWGVDENRMVVTTPSGAGGGWHPLGPIARRKAWELLRPPIVLPTIEFLADLHTADVKPAVGDRPIYWSVWNDIFGGGENYVFLTCEGLGAREHGAEALVQTKDLLAAYEDRNMSAGEMDEYRKFLAKVAADLAGLPA